TETEKHANDLTLVRLRSIDGNPSEYKVFVASWLGYGVREARKRYVGALLQGTDVGHVRERHDPCLPRGLRTTIDGHILPPNSPVPGNDSYLFGTGNFEGCLNRTFPLLEKDAPCNDEPCLLHGVHV